MYVCMYDICMYMYVYFGAEDQTLGLEHAGEVHWATAPDPQYIFNDFPPYMWLNGLRKF